MKRIIAIFCFILPILVFANNSIESIRPSEILGEWTIAFIQSDDVSLIQEVSPKNKITFGEDYYIQELTDNNDETSPFRMRAEYMANKIIVSLGDSSTEFEIKQFKDDRMIVKVYSNTFYMYR